MKNAIITIGIYNSIVSLCIASCVFFCGVAVKHIKDINNTFYISVGMLLSYVGLGGYFLWRSMWRSAHLSRDASVWMIDHFIAWGFLGLFVCGSVLILRALSFDYWMYALMIALSVFFLKVFML